MPPFFESTRYVTAAGWLAFAATGMGLVCFLL